MKSTKYPPPLEAPASILLFAMMMGGLGDSIRKSLTIKAAAERLTPEQRQEAIQLSTSTPLSMLEAIGKVKSGQSYEDWIAEHNVLNAARGLYTKPRDLDSLQEEHRVWLGKLGSQPVDLQMRLRRFVEEAAELTQAAGLDFPTFIKVAADSYSRPEGEVHQELGGTMVTLLCLANVLGLSAWDEGVREFDRINTPEMIAKIAAKQKVKAERGI